MVFNGYKFIVAIFLVSLFASTAFADQEFYVKEFNCEVGYQESYLMEGQSSLELSDPVVYGANRPQQCTIGFMFTLPNRSTVVKPLTCELGQYGYPQQGTSKCKITDARISVPNNSRFVKAFANKIITGNYWGEVDKGCVYATEESNSRRDVRENMGPRVTLTGKGRNTKATVQHLYACNPYTGVNSFNK